MEDLQTGKNNICDTLNAGSERVEPLETAVTGCCTAQPRPIQPDDHNALLSFMLRHRCAHLIIRRYWTVGYEPAPIIALFHSLPRRLRSAIGEALDAARRCRDPAAAAADADAEWE